MLAWGMRECLVSMAEDHTVLGWQQRVRRLPDAALLTDDDALV